MYLPCIELGGDQGHGNGKECRRHAEQNVEIGRGRQGKADQQGGEGKAGIAEDRVKGRLKALGDQHQQNIGDDQQGVEIVKKIAMLHAGYSAVNRIDPHIDENAEQDQGKPFFGGHKTEEIGGFQGFFMGG